MRPSILPLLPGVALLASLTATPAAAVSGQVVDWTSAGAGTVAGLQVTFTGGARSLETSPVWLNVLFNTVNSYGLFSTVEGIEFSAGPSTARDYTISFSAPVTGVVMHLGSLASTITFDRSISKLSGQPIFAVTGNTVSGVTINSGPYSDANGSIALGDLQTFSFSVSPYSPGGEGIGMQLVINALPPVPEPGSLALMLGGVAALGALARRRSTQA
jgi:hypothetical protein